jgi:outer membrane protein assembly factor BamB
VQKHTRAWVVTLLLSIIVPMIIVGVIVFNVVRKAQRTFKDDMPSSTTLGHRKLTPNQVPLAQRPPSWQGTDSVLVADVDGDGTPELIGRGRQVHAGDVVMLLALDLATGTPKWTSEVLGTYSETYRGALALSGDLILFSNDTGEIQTFNVADGKRRWRAQLDERAEQFCAGDATTVIAVGKDDVLRPLARADGAAGPTRTAPGKGKSPWDKPPPCEVLPSDDTTAFERHTKAARGHGGEAHGINVSSRFALPDGGTLLSGARAEGTRVTTLVALDAKGNQSWRTTAAVDALSAEGAARYVVLGEREVCILYYARDSRVGCFGLADGKRLWDVEAPSFFEGLIVIGRTLVMTTHRNLQVMELDTGTVRWSRE